MEEASDVVRVDHNTEDPHAAAALAADSDVDGEDAGEGPADTARSGGGLGGGPRVVVVALATVYGTRSSGRCGAIVVAPLL